MSATKKTTREAWHYVTKGDFPEVGQLVWVQAVSLAEWARAIVKREPCGSPVRFQTESMYGGQLKSTGLHYWENLTCHDIVIAWREHESPSDTGEVLKGTEAAQRLAAKNDTYLFFLLASALNMNPNVMKPVIREKMKKFKARLKEVGESAFVNENTNVVDAYCYDYIDEARGLVFSVEEHSGHYVIVQTKKGSDKSHYAKDFPQTQKIFPTAMDAAKALMAEAERQKWRRAG